MEKIKAIIFDFDGVIVDSVGIKTKAFAEIYSEYGNGVVQKVVQHHLINGGISRSEKFKHYHTVYLKRDLSAKELASLEARFSELVKKKVVDAPYIEGALEFLSGNYRRYDFYVASGTPEDELIEIIGKRNLTRFFRKIYGSPLSKEKIVADIISTRGYLRSEIVFVGDAISDKMAAEKSQIAFIAMTSSDSGLLGNERYQVHSFVGFEDCLNTLVNNF